MCKTSLTTFIIAVIIGMTAAALGQNYYAYTEEGNAVTLTAQDSIISAKLADGLQLWSELFMQEPALDDSREPVPITDGFVLLHVTPGFNTNSLLNRLRSLPGILFANHAFLDLYDNPIYLTETFVCNFDASTTPSQIDSMLGEHALVIVDSLFADPHWLQLQLTAQTDLDVLTLANQFHESPLVRWAKADMVLNLELYGSPNDTYWTYQWHFQNTGQTGGTPDADIDLDEARNYPISPSASIIVAVTDDGFAPHEDFAANRFADGWNYYTDSADYKPGEFAAHGMGTMGIIAASTDNSTGVASVVGNKVKIIGQRITDDDGWDFASDGDIARAFSDAVLKGARVISNSWGCPNCGGVAYPNTTYWIRKADSAGVVVVFASGNWATRYPGTVAWPAKMPEVLAVGATNNMDQRWSYSMYGPELDVVAPSDTTSLKGKIWTLDQMGNSGYIPAYDYCTPTTNDYDCKFGGTSAACPQVAGIAALIMLYRPDLVGQPAAVKDIIRQSVDDKGSAGWDQYYGWGRVNALKAMVNSCIYCGDADNSGEINISDVTYLIAFISQGGPAPGDCRYWRGLGDANGDGTINISDAVFLIAYIFAGGAHPHCQGL